MLSLAPAWYNHSRVKHSIYFPITLGSRSLSEPLKAISLVGAKFSLERLSRGRRTNIIYAPIAALPAKTVRKINTLFHH